MNRLTVEFGADKSEVVRGWAILFMICLHNDCGGAFKICVPMFTFLVGYGYWFAKRKNLVHAAMRSWHLLSHFWLILLGIFLPVAIWRGGYVPSVGNVLENMFGLESNLNWYSWYIYFYLYAMLTMIPCSRLIVRFGLWAVGTLIVVCFGLVGGIHLIPGWSDNIWWQAIHDCLLCSPVMFSGFYMAANNSVAKIRIAHSVSVAVGWVAVAVAIFFIRKLPMMAVLDFVLVPVFVVAIVALFNIVRERYLVGVLTALGRQSMNMWFLHALFATSCTAVVFAPLLTWIEPRWAMIATMVAVSYLGSKLVNAVYARLR